MKKLKKIIKALIIILVIAAIVSLAIYKVKKKKEELAHLKPIKKAPLPVEVRKVKIGVLPITEHYLGEIRPVLSARISSRISGYLFEMNKYEGDPVKKGEIVARIDPRQIKERISSIEADIEGAKSDVITKKHIYERDSELYRNKAVSKEKFEISRNAYILALSRLRRLKADLESAKIDLSYADVRAPFDGVVLKRLSEPGDLIVPGKPIIEIEEPDKGYRILVRVPESLISRLKPKGEVYLVENGKRIRAKIYKVHPAVETGTLGTVEIRLPYRPFGLPTYGRVGVDIVISKAYGAIVPLRALLENVKRNYVFIAIPEKGNIGRVHVVPVIIVGRSGEKALVKGDLKENDMVICADESILLRLYEGEKVYISR